MKKLLIACAAVMTAAVAMATMSFAATTEYDYAPGDGSVSLTDTEAINKISTLTGQQITVIVVKANPDGTFPTTIADSDIIYINQDVQGTLSLTDMKVKDASDTVTGLAAGEYYIAVGAENLTDGAAEPKPIILTQKFTVGVTEEPPVVNPEPTVLRGDVDGDGIAGQPKDANYLLRHVLKWTGYGDIL